MATWRVYLGILKTSHLSEHTDFPPSCPSLCLLQSFSVNDTTIIYPVTKAEFQGTLLILPLPHIPYRSNPHGISTSISLVQTTSAKSPNLPAFVPISPIHAFHVAPGPGDDDSSRNLSMTSQCWASLPWPVSLCVCCQQCIRTLSTSLTLCYLQRACFWFSTSPVPPALPIFPPTQSLCTCLVLVPQEGLYPSSCKASLTVILQLI